MKHYQVEVNQPERETDKAWGFDMGGTQQRVKKVGSTTYVLTDEVLTWIPKSQCKLVEENGKLWIIAPEWLARKNGLHLAVKYGMGFVVNG